MSNPRVLFLDEPTVGLDPRIRHELLDVIAGLRSREEMTSVLTTHYLDEAQRLCDRVAIIHEGTIVALDSPAALLAGLGREILEFRVGGSPEAALASLRDRGVAGTDALVVGARVTVPLHEHVPTDALAVIDGSHLRVVGNRDARPDVGRRLPAPDRRAHRARRLTRRGPRTFEPRRSHMSAIAQAPTIALPAPRRARAAGALLTLARRRASLTSKTPRQIAVPLLGPALLALVVAPALKVATGVCTPTSTTPRSSASEPSAW